MKIHQRLFWLHAFVQCTPLGGLLANQHWALIHEGVHGHLPAWQSRLLCALYGSPFEALRHYHRRHHAENRISERIDELPAPLYWPNLLGGLYVLEVLLCLTRWQGALIVGLQVLLLWAWGWWYVAALVVRALLVSVADYAYHYGGDIDPLQGRDLQAPAWLQAYLLNFNLHGAHHRSPSTPGPCLRVDTYTGRFWPAICNQFKGPIHVHHPDSSAPTWPGA